MKTFMKLEDVHLVMTYDENPGYVYNLIVKRKDNTIAFIYRCRHYEDSYQQKGVMKRMDEVAEDIKSAIKKGESFIEFTLPDI